MIPEISLDNEIGGGDNFAICGNQREVVYDGKSAWKPLFSIRRENSTFSDSVSKGNGNPKGTLQQFQDGRWVALPCREIAIGNRGDTAGKTDNTLIYSGSLHGETSGKSPKNEVTSSPNRTSMTMLETASNSDASPQLCETRLSMSDTGDYDVLAEDLSVAIDTDSFLEELKFVLSSTIFQWVVFANACYTASVIAMSTFGSAFLMNLGFTQKETTASITMGLVAAISGLLGTIMGGWVIDRKESSCDDDVTCTSQCSLSDLRVDRETPEKR